MPKIVTLFVSVAILITTMSSATFAQPTKARLGHVFASNSPAAVAANAFARCVNTNTDGAISVSVFPDGLLGGDEALGRALARGNLEFAFVNPGSLTGLDPLLDIHYLPYIVTNYQQADRIFYNPNGILQTTLTNVMSEHGMRALAWFELGFRAVTNSVRPVHTASDLDGLRLRVPGSVAIRTFFDQAGVKTVTMPFTELFVALQQGVVDGQDNGVNITYNSRLFEAQKYMTLTNHVYAMGAITVSERFWDGLSASDQKSISACAVKSASAQIENNRAKTSDYLHDLEESDISVTKLSSEEMATFVKIGRSVWQKLADVYGADRIRKLRDEVDTLAP